jgi:hypothetical protein
MYKLLIILTCTHLATATIYIPGTQLCPVVTITENSICRGHKDFWSKPIDTSRSFEDIKEGTELESERSVQDRADSFFNMYKGLVCVYQQDYILYTWYALRDRDQLTQNAPIAVEKRELKGFTFKTLTEIRRISYWTTNRTVCDEIMPNQHEYVTSTGSYNSVSSGIFVLMISIIILII